MIETGLYIPIVLFIAGVITKIIHKVILKVGIKQEYEYKQSDTIYAINLTASVLALMYSCADYTVGLMIFAVILGKYIWIDTSIESKGIKAVFTNMISWYRKRDPDTFSGVFDFYFGYFVLCFVLTLIFINL